MSLVVDASVAVQWFVRAPGRERANGIVRSGEALIAPDIVIAEMANAAWRGTTFHDMSRETATDMVREATRFFSELVPSASLKNRAFAIALELRHPVYDCFYLALAELRNLTFVTADARLLRRCANSTFAARMIAL
jgi:predicted nucleic acid-binding protein